MVTGTLGLFAAASGKWYNQQLRVFLLDLSLFNSRSQLKQVARKLGEKRMRCGTWEGCALFTTPLCWRAALPSETAANSLQLRCTTRSCDPSALCCGHQLPAQSGCTSKRRLSAVAELLLFPPEARRYPCRLNPLLVSMFFRSSPARDHCMEKNSAGGHLATSKWGPGKGE